MNKCSDRSCPFPALVDGYCRRHWEMANPISRYGEIDALRAHYLEQSTAKGGAASDYRPRDNKARGSKVKKMTEDEKADHIALVNLIAEETVKIGLNELSTEA